MTVIPFSQALRERTWGSHGDSEGATFMSDLMQGKGTRDDYIAMVAQHYFDHTSKSGASFVTRIKRTGWTRTRRSWTVGENIGYGSGSLATPREMVRAWMNSAGHRQNILARQFKVIGIGVANGAPTGGGGATYATDFGG